MFKGTGDINLMKKRLLVPLISVPERLPIATLSPTILGTLIIEIS